LARDGVTWRPAGTRTGDGAERYAGIASPRHKDRGSENNKALQEEAFPEGAWRVAATGPAPAKTLPVTKGKGAGGIGELGG